MNKILISIIAFLIILVIWNSCNYQRSRNQLINEISEFNIKEQKFTTKIRKDSSTISEQKQVIVSQKEAISLGLLKLDGNINKVKSQVSQVANFKKTDFFVPYFENEQDTSAYFSNTNRIDTVNSAKDTSDFITLPKLFKYNEKYLSVYGKIMKKGVLFDSIQIPNETKVTIGTKKTGFLNLKRESVVEVTNSNPYISISKLNSVVIKESKPFYKKSGLLIGIGIVSGFILQNKLK